MGAPPCEAGARSCYGWATVSTTRRGTRGGARRRRSTKAAAAARSAPAAPAPEEEEAAEASPDAAPAAPESAAPAPETPAAPPAAAPETAPEGPPPFATAMPEKLFAARTPPPLPYRPPPTRRRAVFFDVENTSKAEHITRVIEHLQLDWVGCATELVAVGNWRVIGHDTARLLAEQGAHLVHSAPATGVRDWSDLRIAVAAGVWLASARPGDSLEIVTDDQAFDAVGDVAASLGIAFRRLSYRALAGVLGATPMAEPAAGGESRRRRSRGGRRGRRGGAARTPAPASAARSGVEPERAPSGEGHTAPHDEILAVVRELVARSPEGGVSIDSLSNALKARGFSRPPGSPRLITRLRRIKELEVSRSGTIRLLNGSAAETAEPPAMPFRGEAAVEADASGREGAEPGEGESVEPAADGEGAAPAAPRRRRRRGGRRRRGRGGTQALAAGPP